MDSHKRCSRRQLFEYGVLGVAGYAIASHSNYIGSPFARAVELELKDGRLVQGAMAPLSSVAASVDSASASEKVESIRVIDDKLRRIYVPKAQIVDAHDEQIVEVPEVFEFKQRVANPDSGLALIGTVLKSEPFDKYGRRTVTLASDRGPKDVIQAITRMEPRWTRVQGVNIGWDMRIATTNFPTDQLMAILLQTVVNDEPDHYKRVARFFIQSERYEAAAQVLERLIASRSSDVAKVKMKEELEPIIQSIRHFTGDYLYRELQFRQQAGQYRLVAAVLEKFPADGASDRTLVGIRDMLRLSQQQRQTIAELPGQLKECIDQVPEEGVRAQFTELYEEIQRDLTPDLLDRFAAFRTLGKDANIPAEERLALAVSGWLVGKDNANRQRAIAISLLRIREHILRYLREENDLTRSMLVSDWQSEAGATVPLVTALLSHMPPPFSDKLPEPVGMGEYHVSIPIGGTAGRSETTLRYRIQLPSEYNPYRRYPTIVALHGERSDAGKELDWWAGLRRGEGPQAERQGQASRRGYIVLAPEWMTESQTSYGFSAREHAIVLASLRDACRKFAIDTDRVFLSGHSVGADAAWDIGPAHPDLWAGVIPITGTTRMYGDFIYPNTMYVPMYIVCGEKDPGRTITENARVLDRMMTRRLCNVTVVEFIGRGHDDFSDEIHHLYDWMALHKRNFFPDAFEVRMMRPWDNFFWWVELLGVPSKLLVEPTEWRMNRPARPAEIRAKVSPKRDSLFVQSPADEVVLWVSPELLNIEENVELRLNGREIPLHRLTPSIEILLEDARRRCDLQHPFSIRVSSKYKAKRG